VLTVAVLGPVELRSDGARLAPPTGKARDLLVRLAVDAGHPVRADRLIEDLWPDEPQRVAPNTLQAKVSILRRALAEPGLVVGDRAGYTLSLEPHHVDALEVLVLAESAARRRTDGDAAGAEQARSAALALFPVGEVLPDAGDAAWVEPHRARLEDVRLRLTADRLAALVDHGAAGDAVGELDALVAAYPLREELWTLLITALYRAGRQADALAAYRRVQHHLTHELGLRPGPELAALERRVLTHDPDLLADPARGHPTPAAVPPASPPDHRPPEHPPPDHRPPGNVPPPSTRCVGRRAEVTELLALVDRHRLVTVTGPAGVGKSRTAIEVAAASRRSGGAWLVRLESARSADSVWHAVGEAFGVAAATETQVLDRLRGADLLLVLDGCEHLDDTLPAVLDRMAAEAPGVRVLATSQAPVRVDGERVVPLQPLGLDDSVALFAERATARRASFALDGADAEVVTAVCRSLDGLPLAIELAAARVAVLSVQEIARRLDDRFALLADPTGGGPERHRALRAAIAWSYDLLFPDDQRGLWALACFVDGAPLAGVERVMVALGVPHDAVLDVVGRLVDRSLVSVEVTARGDVRYRLLDSIRRYSLDRAEEAGLLDAARAAHAAWFAEAATRAAVDARGPDQAGAVRLVRAERANIDAALAWCAAHDPVRGLRIAGGFGWAWVVLGAGVDAAARLRAAEAAARDTAASHDRVDALLHAGLLEGFGGDVERAAADLDDAATLATEDAQDAVGVVLLHLALVRLQQGRPHDALGLLGECRPHLAPDDGWHEGLRLLLTASAHIALGETAAGRVACDAALAVMGPLGDRWAVIHGEAMLGALAGAEHRFAAAATHLARAAEAAHALGFDAAAAYHLTSLGRAQAQGGDDRAARSTLEQAIAAAAAAGDGRMVATGRGHLGRLLRRLGDRDAARGHADAAHAWYASAGGGEGALLVDHLRAALDADDDVPGADDALRAVLARALADDDAEVQVLALDTLAVVQVGRGRRDAARVLVGAADRVLPRAQHLVTATDRTDRARAVVLLDDGRSDDRGDGDVATEGADVRAT
jgi:predicted ATPase/DNA-binding SARP family transcriptional activator